MTSACLLYQDDEAHLERRFLIFANEETRENFIFFGKPLADIPID